MSGILSTMAGNIWRIQVQVGDKVEEGQEVVILESMKMEIPIEAETNGTVIKLKVNEGEFVNEGDVLMEIE